MSTLGLAGLILAGEFALIAWLILLIFLRRQRQRAGREQQQAAKVRETVASGETPRRAALSKVFASTYGLSGSELDERVDEFVTREQAFYDAMFSIYTERDADRLDEIPDELARVIHPWADMSARNAVAADALAQTAEENASLAAELDSTRKTLDGLMAEYAKAFPSAPMRSGASSDSPGTSPGDDSHETSAEDTDADADVDLGDWDPDESGEPPQTPDERELAAAKEELEGLSDLFEPDEEDADGDKPG